ncbi:MAG: hypothetical protein GXO90_10585, partial [FCB group bacterium]|nr:hypothetical protein [FCB group bacterium]
MNKILMIALFSLHLGFARDARLESRLSSTPFPPNQMTISPAMESDTLLNESFEDMSALTGWTVYDLDNDGNAWSLYQEEAPGDTVAHDGTKGVGIFYN